MIVVSRYRRTKTLEHHLGNPAFHDLICAPTCTPAWVTPATAIDDPRSEVKVVLIQAVRARLGLKETLDEVGAATTSSVSLL